MRFPPFPRILGVPQRERFKHPRFCFGVFQKSKGWRVRDYTQLREWQYTTETWMSVLSPCHSSSSISLNSGDRWRTPSSWIVSMDWPAWLGTPFPVLTRFTPARRGSRFPVHAAVSLPCNQEPLNGPSLKGLFSRELSRGKTAH